MLLKTKQKLEQVKEENSTQIKVKDFHSKRKDTRNRKVQEEKEGQSQMPTNTKKRDAYT